MASVIETNTHFSGEILKYLLSGNITRRFPGLYVESFVRPNGVKFLKTSVDREAWTYATIDIKHKAIELIYCFWAFLGNSTVEIIDFFSKETELSVQMITALNYYCKLPDEDPYLETINISRKALRRMKVFVSKNKNLLGGDNAGRVVGRFLQLNGWDNEVARYHAERK